MTATTTAPRLYVRVNTAALRMAIRFSGLTHAEIARKAKLKSPGTVGNLAAGRKGCRPETASAIAKVLKQPVDTLFELRATTN